MLRIFTRVTLGASGNREGDNSAENIAEEEYPAEDNQEVLALDQFHQDNNPDLVINDIDLENNLIQESDTDSESEVFDSNLQDNLLVTRKQRKNGYNVCFNLKNNELKEFFCRIK